MEDKMKEVVLKAETLIEALPYIRDFNGKKVVVKYGGSAMLDEKLQESVIKDVETGWHAADYCSRRRKRN